MAAPKKQGMDGILNSLEKQKRREKQRILEVQRLPEGATEWQLLQEIEALTHELKGELTGFFQHHRRLEQQQVHLENTAPLPSSGRLRLRAQVTSIDRKWVCIKVHCHALGPRGEHRRLARVSYQFRRKA